MKGAERWIPAAGKSPSHFDSALSGARTTGQIRVAHQIAIAFPSGAAAFVERRHDQALAAATIAGGKNSFEVRMVLLEVRFHIRARVAFNFERVEQRLFGSEKTHR